MRFVAMSDTIWMPAFACVEMELQTHCGHLQMHIFGMP